jgi:hypothetical protein
VPLQALDQDDGWHEGRPQAFVAKCFDQRGSLLRSLGEPSDAA